MSSIPPVKDRDNIDQDIRKKIKEETDYEKKMQLIVMHHYLEEKRQIDNDLEKQMASLAASYSQKALKLQQKISDIVEGIAEIQKEEFQDIDRYLDEAEQVDKTKFSDFIEDKEPIPQYWYKCLKNCPMIRNELKDQDANVLNDLKKIEFKPNQDEDLYNFELLFYFRPNDYFLNEVLTKSFTLLDQDQPIKAIGSHIEWKEGKDVTKKTVKKHQKDKKTGAKRQITKEVDDQSFFNFFKTVNLDEEGGFEKMAEEKRGQLEEKMNIDYDIARAIIDEVLPYSLEYYLNARVADNIDYFSKNEDEEDEYIQQKKKIKEEKKEDKIQEKPECQQQ